MLCLRINEKPQFDNPGIAKEIGMNYALVCIIKHQSTDQYLYWPVHQWGFSGPMETNDKTNDANEYNMVKKFQLAEGRPVGYLQTWPRIDWSIDQSVSQSINQSFNQSINQSINQSVNQSINQAVLWWGSNLVDFYLYYKANAAVEKIGWLNYSYTINH